MEFLFQIVMKENESQECALVEYATSEAAEATWKCMRDTEVEAKKVAVSFCIPGSSAVSIYNKIVQQKVFFVLIQIQSFF